MITLLQHPSGQYYHLAEITTSVGANSEKFGVLTGPFNKTPQSLSRPVEVATYDGWINSGSKDPVGDRPVEHHQISGVVTMVPFRTYQPITQYVRKFSYRAFKAGTKEVVFSHLLNPGQTINESSNLVVPSRRYYTARLSSDAVWTVGYGSYNASGKIAGYMSSFMLAPVSQRYYSVSWNFLGSLSEFEACPHYAGTYPTTLRYANLYTPVGEPIPADVLRSTFLTFKSFRKAWIWLPDQVPLEPDVWSDLVQDCVDQVRYVDVNTLSYVYELRDVAKLIPKLPLGKKAFSPKAWASAYLCLRYGLNLTVKDTIALRDGVLRVLASTKELEKSYSTEHARRTSYGDLLGRSYTDEYHYKISYRPIPSQLMDFVRNWDDWGVYPTFSRMWDMIPFSFVLDWFAKVQDFLEQIDTQIKIPYYKVLGVCWSRKVSVYLSACDVFHSDFVLGNLTQVHYVRGTRKDLHPLRYRIELAGTFRNYWEALALIIVNKR